ncbi:O-antigen ligase family protein [Effusibacillus dendaii]|uniref:O-antigen ligase-related domain-containing protein n=1 Tax=Effusibacillus dendaii TaxID=2743772 RepID=A0A7I8DC58_9BACL|nr:O-antigen ligase family protein [Effusibacillus dendaii]BCJ87763.1 hypothetical protein skT53_27480 [Effusibacillus dendaii]
MTQLTGVIGARVNIETAQAYRTNKLFYLLMTILFVGFSFKNGLFFNPSFMISSLYVSAVSIVVLAWLRMSRAQVSGWQMTDLFVGGYFLMVLLTTFTPANQEYAVTGLIRQFDYTLVYLIVRVITSIDRNRQSLLNGLLLSGVVFSLYGLANGFGTLNVNGTIFDENLRRLASNFEYPNAFAIYQAVLFVIAVAASTVETGKIMKRIYPAVAYLLLSSVILTYSRGTWLVLAGMVLLLFLIYPKGTRRRVVIQTAVPLVGLAATIAFLSKAVLQKQSVFGWEITMSGTILAVLVSWLFEAAIRKLTNRLNKKQRVTVAAVVGLVAVLAVAGVVLKVGLPQNLAERISSINLQQFSVVQRFLFYKDGLKVLHDFPVLGAGWDAWKAIHLRYQSYPYISNESHSYLIDIIMSVGVLGTLVWLTMIGMAIWQGIKSLRMFDFKNRVMQSAIFCGLVGLLGHSLIDFDMSYGTNNYLMWALLGMLVPPFTVKFPSILTRNVEISSSQTTWNYGGVVVAVIGAVIAGGFLLSDREMAIANAAKTPDVGLKAAQNATIFAPYRPAAYLKLADFQTQLYKDNQDQKLAAQIKENVDSAVAKAPYQPDNLVRASDYYTRFGDPVKAVDLAKQAWENDPYAMDFAQNYMRVAGSHGAEEYSKDKGKSKQFFADIISTYQNIEQRIADFKNLPSVLKPEYDYSITPEMKLYYGEANVYLGKYEEAKKVLEPLLTAAQQQDQNRAKVMLAAIQKRQGQSVDLNLLAPTLTDPKLKQYFEGLAKLEPLQ